MARTAPAHMRELGAWRRTGGMGGALVALARACLLLLTLVVAIVVVVDKRYGLGAYQPAPRLVGNLVLTAVVCAALGVAVWFWRRRPQDGEPWLDGRKSLVIEIVLTALLFALQVLAFLKAGVLGGWDVLFVSEAAGTDLPLGQNIRPYLSTYFAAFPNNQFAVWVLHCVWSVAKAMWPGSTVLPTSYFAFFSSACVCAGLLLTSRAVWRLWGSGVASLVTHLLGTLLVGINPWFMIPYTDTLCLPVIAAMLYVGVRIALAQSPGPAWLALLGALGVLGYKLKPTALLIFGMLVLCVVIPRLWHLAREGSRQGRRRAVAGMLAGMVGCGLVFGLAFVATRSLGFSSYDHEDSYPLEYFLVFGLSEEGTWNEEDHELTAGLPDYASRQAAEREAIVQRVVGYGPEGLALHSLQKLLRTYNDGSFAWGGEGSFFSVTNASDEGLGRILASFWYVGNENYLVFTTLCHAFWLVVLMGLVVAFVASLQKEVADTGQSAGELALIAAAALALVLLTVYLVVFETRARYLYHYLPVFMFVAVWGYRWLFLRAERGSARA